VNSDFTHDFLRPLKSCQLERNRIIPFFRQLKPSSIKQIETSYSQNETVLKQVEKFLFCGIHLNTGLNYNINVPMEVI
jgi:hypothetical protein